MSVHHLLEHEVEETPSEVRSISSVMVDQLPSSLESDLDILHVLGLECLLSQLKHIAKVRILSLFE